MPTRSAARATQPRGCAPARPPPSVQQRRGRRRRWPPLPNAPLPAAKLREYVGPAAVEALAALAPGDGHRAGARRRRLPRAAPGRARTESRARAGGGRSGAARRVAPPRRRRRAARLSRRAARARRHRHHAERCHEARAAMRRSCALSPAAASCRRSARRRTAAASRTRAWKLTRDGAIVRVRIPRLELTRLALDPVLEPGTQAAVIGLLAERVRLSSHGQRCVPSADPMPVAAPDGWIVYEWALKCPDPGAPVVSSTLLLDVAPSHLHFARVEMPDGSVREAVLSDAQTTLVARRPRSGDGPDRRSRHQPRRLRRARRRAHRDRLRPHRLRARAAAARGEPARGRRARDRLHRRPQPHARTRGARRASGPRRARSRR